MDDIIDITQVPTYFNIISKNEEYIHGYLEDVGYLDHLINWHHIETGSSFQIRHTSDYLKKPRSRVYESDILTGENTFRIRTGFRIYRCQYGGHTRDKSLDPPIERDPNKKMRRTLKYSKRLGCPARLSVFNYKIFLNLKTTDLSRPKRLNKKKLIYSGMKDNFKNLKTKDYCEVYLPLVSSHQYHAVIEENIYQKLHSPIQPMKNNQIKNDITKDVDENLMVPPFSYETEVRTERSNSEHPKGKTIYVIKKWGNKINNIENNLMVKSEPVKFTPLITQKRCSVVAYPCGHESNKIPNGIENFDTIICPTCRGSWSLTRAGSSQEDQVGTCGISWEKSDIITFNFN